MSKEYKYRVDCRCDVCGKEVVEYITREGVEDCVIPAGFVRFKELDVCDSHKMEMRETKLTVGYNREFYADGVLLTLS